MKKHYLKTIALYIIIVVVVIFILFPVYWLFLMSIKTNAENLVMPPSLIFKPTAENYIRALYGRTRWEAHFGEAEKKVTEAAAPSGISVMGNILIVASLTTLASLVLSIPAAYSFLDSSLREVKIFSFIS